MINVSIIDYKMGNIFSIVSVCKKVGLNPIVTRNKKKILETNALILPGVGSFEKAMKNINKFGLKPVIKEFFLTGRPIVGICLGMQLFFEKSEEGKNTNGLGLINGEVKSFKSLLNIKQSYLNLGWNEIKVVNKNSYLNNTLSKERFYFVHSFYCKPKKISYVTSYSKIKNYKFCSSIKFKNIEGYQFHPEKSSMNGIKIYTELKKQLSKF